MQMLKRGFSCNRRILFALFFAFLIVSYCCHPAWAQGKKGDLSTVTNADSLFTQAQLALTIDGNVEDALALFIRVAELQPDNAPAHAQISSIYSHSGKYSSALQEIKKATQLDTANMEYQDQMAVLLTQTGQYDKAAAIFGKLANNSPDPTEFLMKQAFCYNLAKEYRKALAVISKIKPDSKEAKEQILKDKLKLFAHLEMPDSIIHTAHQLIALNPDDPDNYVMAAVSEDLFHYGRNAVRTIDTALERFPKDPKIVRGAIALYGKYDHPKLKAFYNKLLESEAYSAEEKAILFYPLAEMKDKDSFANHLLHEKLPLLAFSPSPNKNAVLLYTAVENSEGNYESAVNICKRALAADSNEILYWNSLLLSFQQMGENDSMAFYNSMALERFPERRIPHYYDALVKYDSGDTAGSIAALEKTRKIIDKDSIISDFQIYAFLGDLYESVGNHDSAGVNYQNALSIYPNSLVLLNNYSYMLAEQGSNLDTALSLSAKTLATNPNESMYLDTYGWILYKQKKYKQAKSYIEKAIQNMPQPDATLYEHLGDVEDALGNRRKARKHWKKALDLGSSSGGLKHKLNR